jgi:DNA-directed RNA polymerase specialized sigma24 family protein
LPDRENKRGTAIDYLPHLFARLDQNRDTAGRLYEDLRRRLILFFRLRRPQEAEDLADTVLDRVARKIAEGTQIEKVEFYIVGVARFVLRERTAASEHEARARQEMIHVQKMQVALPVELPVETSVLALEDCLKGLGERDRSMILSYYGSDGDGRVRVRQELAQQLGISLNALHNRALRLRKQLERCVEKHKKKGT